jgi:hypothetical protein
VLTAYGLPCAYHPPSWQPTSQRLSDSSGSLTASHLTSQWLLPQTLAVLFTAWPSRFSFEILVEACMVPYFLHSADLKTIILWTMPKWATYLYVQPRPTWTLASAASECIDASLWGREFHADNSQGGLGKQRISGLLSHKSLWNSWATVADTCNPSYMSSGRL